jgi:mono/diheme cytochrome c family protein
LNYQDSIGPLFQERCGACHSGPGGIQGLDLTSYAGVLKGGASGPAIIAGDPEMSLIIVKQSSEQSHFGQLTPEELDLVVQWITAGAPEE